MHLALKKVLKNFDFTFDNLGNDFDDMPMRYHFNVTTYWRLALPKVLTSYGIKNAIYLDRDILVVCFARALQYKSKW